MSEAVASSSVSALMDSERHQDACPVVNGLSIFLQRALEAIIRLLHVELELACLVVAQLFGCAHLIQRDEPLHNLALALEFLVRDLVGGLYDLDEQWVQRVLLH